MKGESLEQLKAVINSGRAVISADDETIVAIAQEAIDSGKNATFYLPSAVANSIRSRYFTPEHRKARGIEPISAEEAAKIKSELGIENVETFRCNRITCECGQIYGAFEFLQQGIREHGAEIVRAVFALDNFSMINANRRLAEICPACNQKLAARDGGIEYDCDSYGGCCYEPPR